MRIRCAWSALVRTPNSSRGDPQTLARPIGDLGRRNRLRAQSAPVGELELWFADCVVSAETPTNKQIAALVEGSKHHVGDLAAGDEVDGASQGIKVP